MDGNENPNPARTSLWRNARLATLREELGPLGIIEDGVIAVRGERIVYAGPEAGLPSSLLAPTRSSIAKAAGSPRR